MRCVNAYGPGQSAAVPFGSSKVRKVTPSFVCRALSGLPIEVYGDGEQVSDMLYVTDLAKVLVRSLEASVAGVVSDIPIEAGPIEHNTINTFATNILDAVFDYTHVRVPLVHLPMRPGEIPGATVTANVDTLGCVGIDPDGFVDLHEGVKRTVAWFVENQGVTWHPLVS